MIKYESTPRPLIEEHFHIRELIEAQEKRAEDRDVHRNRIKERQERKDLIKDSKMVCITDFYCTKCKEDFKSMSIKEEQEDWTNSEQTLAFYRSKCSKGHRCIRFITDKLRDGFWMKSKFVALDRGNHTADILQPFETNYNLLYGKK